jgi:hypothetical protein
MDRHRASLAGSLASAALAIFAALATRAHAQVELPTTGQPLAFDLNGFEVPPGGHLQGVQMGPADGEQRYAFLSHDSQTVGYLLVVEFPADLGGPGRAIHLQKFPSDGQSPPLRHAGGIQLCENVLAVGVEDNQQKTRSQVQFWDVANPREPKQYEHLTIRRQGEPEDQTAGGVALARTDGRYIAAVANWDSRAIDFYQTNGRPLTDAECRFEMQVRWVAATADRSSWRPDRDTGQYQAINLIAGPDGKLLLAGFATTPTGHDVVDVFAVELGQSPEQILRKVSRQPMKLTEGNHFRNAGGLWLDGDRIAVLASPRNLAPRTTLNLAR